MHEPSPQKFTYFIGIDISKNELDFAVMHGRKFLFHQEIKNEPDEIASFVTGLRRLPGFIITRAVFCMEHTGIYCNHATSVLRKLKGNIVIENALQIRNSLGIMRGKHDKIDAIRIAKYSYTNREDLRVMGSKRQVVVQLAGLFTLRNRLVGVRVALKMPLSEQLSFVKKGIQSQAVEGCKASLNAVEQDIRNVEKTIDQLIKSDKRLDHLNRIITSVPGIGKILAVQIILSTNEFLDITNPKKFACYAGVAPFKKDSGILVRRARISPIANKYVKSLLHICALSTLRKGEFKEYYDRRVAEGKHKMSVINAIRYKLILRVFACLSQDRLYQTVYQRTPPANDITAGPNYNPSEVTGLEQDIIPAVTL